MGWDMGRNEPSSTHNICRHRASSFHFGWGGRQEGSAERLILRVLPVGLLGAGSKLTEQSLP